MTAVKANKIYTIAESDKAQYLADGYDIMDDDGKIIAHNPHKTVLYSEHRTALDKIAELEAKLSKKPKGKGEPDPESGTEA